MLFREFKKKSQKLLTFVKMVENYCSVPICLDRLLDLASSILTWRCGRNHVKQKC